jgi:nitroreductase / dihydropteridine reductase
MQNLNEALAWRRANKQFDTTKTLTDEQVRSLLETTILAPSSFGLQPWKFVVVSNPEVKAKLGGTGYGQPQFTTASHVVAFAVNKNVDAAYVDAYMADIARVREIPVETLAGFSDMIKGTIASRTPEQIVEWSGRQVYIALGTLIAAASLESIDASPMEGFDGDAFDEILGLKSEGFHTLAVVALGYRSEDDQYAKMKKARFPYSMLVKEM